MRCPEAKQVAAVGLLVGSVVVLLGAAEYADREVDTKQVLPAVRVEPAVEALSSAAETLIADPEEALRERTIQEAAEHYDIDADLAATIHETARENGIEPELAFGLVWVESRFEPTAVSSAGAIGLAQVMPATARELNPEIEESELLDPEENLRLGMSYLGNLLERYDGDKRLALTAYNRGPGTVARVKAAGEEPYNGYAGMVLENQLPDRHPVRNALEELGVVGD